MKKAEGRCDGWRTFRVDGGSAITVKSCETAEKLYHHHRLPTLINGEQKLVLNFETTAKAPMCPKIAFYVAEGVSLKSSFAAS